MPKYELEANRYFYYGIYYYLMVSKEVLKILKPNVLMYTGLLFVIRFYNNVTNRISKTAKND